nr:MAG TPA: hypothetical protein [Caudoviricetes sp.]
MLSAASYRNSRYLICYIYISIRLTISLLLNCTYSR